MNKDKDRRSVYRSQMTSQLLLQYLGALALWFVGVIVFIFVCWQVCRQITWYATDWLYSILSWVESYILLLGSLTVLAGWVVISYRFLSKPLRYLDELVASSEQMVLSPESSVRLPPAMKNVQDELNLVRERSLRSALEAKEAEQRKNDLLVYLAHDLKTPLTSVIGYLTLLRDEPQLSPEFRARYTDIALDKAQRLEELINEFFDITRFSLSTLRLEEEQISLSRMLAQITSEFLPILSEKELTWRTEIAPDVELLCDPDKMERVFDNLIRNAVNYSYPGTEIELSMKPSWAWPSDSATDGTDSPRCVLITVSNRGKTIPPDKLNRIFEQFFRLDSSRATATGGAGLGLAISKEIVELHGGSISAASEDERITFTVKLPLHQTRLS